MNGYEWRQILGARLLRFKDLLFQVKIVPFSDFFTFYRFMRPNFERRRDSCLVSLGNVRNVGKATFGMAWPKKDRCRAANLAGTARFLTEVMRFLQFFGCAANWANNNPYIFIEDSLRTSEETETFLALKTQRDRCCGRFYALNIFSTRSWQRHKLSLKNFLFLVWYPYPTPVRSQPSDLRHNADYCCQRFTSKPSSSKPSFLIHLVQKSARRTPSSKSVSRDQDKTKDPGLKDIPTGPCVLNTDRNKINFPRLFFQIHAATCAPAAVRQSATKA